MRFTGILLPNKRQSLLATLTVLLLQREQTVTAGKRLLKGLFQLTSLLPSSTTSLVCLAFVPRTHSETQSIVSNLITNFAYRRHSELLWVTMIVNNWYLFWKTVQKLGNLFINKICSMRMDCKSHVLASREGEWDWFLYCCADAALLSLMGWTFLIDHEYIWLHAIVHVSWGHYISC